MHEVGSDNSDSSFITSDEDSGFEEEKKVVSKSPKLIPKSNMSNEGGFSSLGKSSSFGVQAFNKNSKQSKFSKNYKEDEKSEDSLSSDEKKPPSIQLS